MILSTCGIRQLPPTNIVYRKLWPLNGAFRDQEIQLRRYDKGVVGLQEVPRRDTLSLLTYRVRDAEGEAGQSPAEVREYAFCPKAVQRTEAKRSLEQPDPHAGGRDRARTLKEQRRTTMAVRTRVRVRRVRRAGHAQIAEKRPTRSRAHSASRERRRASRHCFRLRSSAVSGCWISAREAAGIREYASTRVRVQKCGAVSAPGRGGACG